MHRRSKPGQVLQFPSSSSIRSGQEERALNKTLKLLGEIRDDLDALESEWSHRWDIRVRELRAEAAGEGKLHKMRS